MKQTMSQSDFLNQWPESQKNQFSFDALRALFDYYEELEEDCGTEIEYDPIAICCEWCEYDSLEAACADYDSCETLEDFQESTQIIELESDGLLIMAF